jgi:tetratricopeptide (TPR) repeat protein
LSHWAGTDVRQSSLLHQITGYARSGALTLAWQVFHGAELERVDDPAVLALRGRLLKDSARTSGSAPDRRRLYREAGDAYARAGAVDGSTYPLINAASLARLAGDQAEASERAGAVLDRGDDPDETPYYQAATRAEALLLLGRVDEAKAALAEAVARAPRAWEDHASTLRQFRLILAETGGDAEWVDILRPPRCLHFAGHMALAAGAQVLERSIREVLEREQVGFGFGALARAPTSSSPRPCWSAGRSCT